MRILIAAMRYPTGPGESFLATELADALVLAGHDVEVLHLDWDGPSGGDVKELRGAKGQRIVRCTARRISGLGRTVRDASKFVLSGRLAARIAGDAFDLETFDAIFMWMPALAFGPLVRRASKAGIRNRLLIVWDFFPDHYREIGRIPFRPVFAAARRYEQSLLGHFTAICCTLPGNSDYLRRNFRVRDEQDVIVAPIWCDATPAPTVERAAIRRRHALPPDPPIAVFGGQLTAGRGFELMLDAARIAGQAGSPLQFLFVGEGPLVGTLAARAASSGNVVYRSAVPRDAYLKLLGACDVGMVATVPGVTSFAFPSKSLDYLRAGLPVVAAVEPGSEFVELLERYSVGGGVGFGDAEGYFRLAERLAFDPELRAEARAGAKRCLAEVFDVAHAVSALTGAMR